MTCCALVYVDDKRRIEILFKDSRTNRVHKSDSCCLNLINYRWGGSFGVDVDFVARTHCSVAYVRADDIWVRILVVSQ